MAAALLRMPPALLLVLQLLLRAPDAAVPVHAFTHFAAYPGTAVARWNRTRHAAQALRHEDLSGDWAASLVAMTNWWCTIRGAVLPTAVPGEVTCFRVMRAQIPPRTGSRQTPYTACSKTWDCVVQ